MISYKDIIIDSKSGYSGAGKNLEKKFKHKNKSFYSKSDGIAFLNDGKTTCQVDSQIGAFFGDMIGKVVVECKNNLEMAGKFIQTTKDKGKGYSG